MAAECSATASRWPSTVTDLICPSSVKSTRVSVASPLAVVDFLYTARSSASYDVTVTVPHPSVVDTCRPIRSTITLPVRVTAPVRLSDVTTSGLPPALSV